MVRDLVSPIKSSFLSCEKDIENIMRKLFVEKREYSNLLKKLLVVNTKDCLDNTTYDSLVEDLNISDLFEKGYIKISPKIAMPEHEEVKAYILISFDNFVPSDNTEFRDCMINFDILCHSDYWDLGQYRIRPLKIAGYIDGILDGCKMSGIGTLQFSGCNELILNQDLSGYTLSYIAVHGSDDYIESSEE